MNTSEPVTNAVVANSSDSTSSCNQVVLKTHLLRHAFATHAAQTEKIPIDIVKTLLHQKDLSVTEYYSVPTHRQNLDTGDSLRDSWLLSLISRRVDCQQ